MPSDTLGLVLRIAAFALVCIAAALTPGPIDPEVARQGRHGSPAPSPNTA